MQNPSQFTIAADAAQRRALVVGAVGSVVLGALVLVALVAAVNVFVGLLVGVAVMVAGAAAWMAYVQRGFAAAMPAVVGDLGRPASAAEQPSMWNALDGIAIRTGVRSPELRVLDLESANALVASDGDQSTVVITTGLLQGCRSVESEVIAAELLCRVRDGSARYGTLVAGLSPLLSRVAGVDEMSLAELLGEQRSVHADAEAVAVTRYPPGLVSAFERMAAAGTRVAAAPATAPLWIAPAVGPGEGVAASLDRTVNQPLEYRMAVLREL